MRILLFLVLLVHSSIFGLGSVLDMEELPPFQLHKEVQNHSLINAMYIIEREIREGLIDANGYAQSLSVYDSHNCLPLHYAVRDNVRDIVHILINAYGADPNAYSPDSRHDYSRMPPLHYALDRGYEYLAATLIRCSRTDVNLVWGGESPLERALEWGNREITNLLVQRGAREAPFIASAA